MIGFLSIEEFSEILSHSVLLWFWDGDIVEACGVEDVGELCSENRFSPGVNDSFDSEHEILIESIL